MKMPGREKFNACMIVTLVVCSFASAGVPKLVDIPEALSAQDQAQLGSSRTLLIQRRGKMQARREWLSKQEPVAGSPLDKECAHEQSLLQQEAADYTTAANSFNTAVKTAATAELKKIEARMARTLSEVESLSERIQDYATAMKEWADLSEEARKKARETAKETLATILLEGLAGRNEKEIDLDTDSLQRINTLLRKRVFMDDHYAKVLTTQHLNSLKTDRQVVSTLQGIKTTLALNEARLNPNREEVARALLEGIEIVSRDPRAALLIADGEIVIDAAYGWLAAKEGRDRVNQLLNLQTDQLKALKSLTDLYKNDVDKRRNLRAVAGSK